MIKEEASVSTILGTFRPALKRQREINERRSFRVGVNQKGNTVNVVAATCNKLKKKL